MKEKLAIAFIIVCWLCYSLGTTEKMPSNATVYVSNNEYFGRPTMEIVSSVDKKKFKSMTLEKARNAGYKPNKESRENGDFIGEDSNLLFYIIGEIGIIKPAKRWNPDGSQNY